MSIGIRRSSARDVPVSWGDELMAKRGYTREFTRSGGAIFIPEDTSKPHLDVSYANSCKQDYDRASYERALVLAQKTSGACISCPLSAYEVTASDPENDHES